MSDIIFHIIVIAVAVLAIFRGFRRKLTNQISSILGFSFGIVGAHVFAPEIEPSIRQIIPLFEGRVTESFAYSFISAAVIYIISLILFSIFTRVLRSALQVFETNVLDAIFGALYTTALYLFNLSLLYNLFVCIDPGSSLVKLTADDDGNLVEGIVLYAPSALGAENVNDLAHKIQLLEAKKISFLNINPGLDVYYSGERSRHVNIGICIRQLKYHNVII